MKDFSQMNDFLSTDEIQKMVDDFFEFYQNSTDKELIYAFDQLCEVADRQCNTYTVLKKEYQNKITKFIIDHIDFNDFEVMDSILYIIPNLGLKDAFQYILKNKYKIKKTSISKMLDQCIKEYGKTVDDPYSDMK